MPRILNIIYVLIFITIGSNLLIFLFLRGSESIFIYLMISLFLLGEFLFIIFLIKRFYESPIVKLEYTIKKFLVGSLKDKELDFEKTLNPHLNYILLFFNKTLNTLKNIKSEFIHGKEIKWEVELAREIQEKLLSKKLIQIPSLVVSAKSKPAREIGGDSYDVINQWDNYYIYVGDATGHGVGAGFIMMMVNALISGYAKVTSNGSQVLAYTNDIIKPRVKANLLMSLLLLRWNEKEKRLFMTGAGHEYLMIYKNSQKKCFKIKSGGVALGMTKDIHKLLKEREVSFEPGDVAVLYSDWVTEALNMAIKDGSEEMFGEQRLVEAIEKAPNIPGREYKSARSVFKNISIELSKFMGYKYYQYDDITLAAILYKPLDYDVKQDFGEEITADFITEWSWEK